MANYSNSEFLNRVYSHSGYSRDREQITNPRVLELLKKEKKLARIEELSKKIPFSAKSRITYEEAIKNKDLRGY